MSAAPIRALVVDDDASARRRLRELAGSVPDLAVIGECVDGRQAVERLDANDVDLVFLDVEMPRLDGFGVIAEIGPERMPPIIFTSAYSEFGVRAFEVMRWTISSSRSTTRASTRRSSGRASRSRRAARTR